MRSIRIGVTCSAVLTLTVSSSALAQYRLPSDGGTTVSLGQPSPWVSTLGAALGRQARPGEIGAIAEARVGLYRELLNRSLGVGGVQLEAYGGTVDTKAEGGVRARLVSPFARIAVGADYSLADRTVRPIFSVVTPARRGGLFRDGSLLRLDYSPGNVRTVTLGIETAMLRRVPFGSTRPSTDRARLGTTPLASHVAPTASPAMLATLTTARSAAQGIFQLCAPWIDHGGSGGAKSDAAVRARIARLQQFIGATGTPRTLQSETVRFHAAVDRAFSLAVNADDIVGDSSSVTGRAVAESAREILLTEVLLPYDRLLGQVKEHDGTSEFAVLARGAFLRWLHVQSRVPRESFDDVTSVFYALLEMIEQNRRAARAETKSSRYVWLPLQLALHPEQHDTQEELDALVTRATRGSFSEGNTVTYLVNEQFQYQLSRTIRDTKNYHVLWVHDFRGYDDAGNPDEMSFRHVLHSYFAAMTERVRAYDSSGVFPTYLIILDEWFYEVNRSRLWMNLLENPTTDRVHLADEFSTWEDSIVVAQDSLRAAISRSTLLTAQRRQYGERWLRNLIKVHVNITNTSDPTYASWNLATGFAVPDNWMRDHRKIVFYDVSEEDPYRGEAIFTGAGVGEHYANQSWEDRSILFRGPAALSLKASLRSLLIKQGIAPNRVPAVLQPRPLAADYADMVQRVSLRERPPRAIELQNGTGHDAKDLNVAKAVLYTLMPPGSVIKIPDSLWNGTFWGSAMIGCALRGVRVVVIAPAYANAPARAFGSMVRSRELLWRLVTVSTVLAPEIAAQGGLLKVGLYASKLPISDIPGKVRSVKTTLEQHGWLRALYDFPPEVYPGLEALASTFGAKAAAVRSAGDFESRPRSLLHLKANFFASREAWRIMARTEWVDVTREFVEQRFGQVQNRETTVGSGAPTADGATRLGNSVIEQWFAEMSPATRERVVFYTILGSANQNDRSFVADGEDGLVISAWPSVIPYLDLLSLVGQSEWVESTAELDALLPRQNMAFRRVAHWFKAMF
jgi:hypothetical protein